MKPADVKKTKLVALSLASTISLSLFYTNCSQSGFQTADMGSLSSSDPVGLSLALRDLDASSANSLSFSYDLSGQNLSSVRTQCYLNSVLQADCSSPIDVSGMPDADYTLTVKATNQNSLVLAQIGRAHV